jgi:ATP-binding cassette, subfamily B, bacterial HlyB/CyaB
MDTGLNALAAIARFHQIPADMDQLAHHFGEPGSVFTDTQLLLAAKSLTLRAKITRIKPSSIQNDILPAIIKTRDGHYLILARASEDNPSSTSSHYRRPINCH